MNQKRGVHTEKTRISKADGDIKMVLSLTTCAIDIDL